MIKQCRLYVPFRNDMKNARDDQVLEEKIVF